MLTLRIRLASLIFGPKIPTLTIHEIPGMAIGNLLSRFMCVTEELELEDGIFLHRLSVSFNVL